MGDVRCPHVLDESWYNTCLLSRYKKCPVEVGCVKQSFIDSTNTTLGQRAGSRVQYRRGLGAGLAPAKAPVKPTIALELTDDESIFNKQRFYFITTHRAVSPYKE